MGVLDDILGGDKDRERGERRENIDKIREKVQEGRQPQEGMERDDTPAPPVRPSELEDEVGMEPSEPQQGPERPEPPRQREGSRRQPARREEPSPPPRERQERGRTEPAAAEPEQQGPTHEDVPEPPEVKDLDVPDIEKGPLFITVDKFRDALEAISDMRRVAREMEDYIGSMEGTLQEDRDTEDGIRQILDEAEGDTDELQDIVSP